MDGNIKVAASYLRKAVSDLQSQIHDIRQNENREKQQENRDENQIAKDIHKDELAIALGATVKDKGRRETAKVGMKLVARDHALRKHRDDIKSQLGQDISQQDNEIRSLEAQISTLKELARSLESWRG